jgi:hypothetical protein
MHTSVVRIWGEMAFLCPSVRSQYGICAPCSTSLAMSPVYVANAKFMSTEHKLWEVATKSSIISAMPDVRRACNFVH